jgi:hypothetical protein
MKTKNIIIRTTFAATHHWPDVDVPGVEYLKYTHRHLFYVEMKWSVSHGNREIEFIDQKKKVDTYLQQLYSGHFLGSKSCEDIALELMNVFNANYVSVFEDNENGAEVYAD